MKTLFYTLTLCCISLCAGAQQIGFTYQAVALDESKAEGFGRDSKGQILLNQVLKVRFTIHEHDVEGAVQYQEVHQTTTDIFGIFRVVIGSGEKLQGTSLEELRWSDQSYFMQVEVDLGNGFVSMGTEVIVVPPFGLNNTIQLLNLAGTQLSISDGNSVDLSNLLGAVRLSEQEVDAYVANNGYLLTEVDGSVTNEIQDLQLTGNQLFITNNPNATIINLSPYLGNNLTEADVDNMVGNNGFLTAENQDLSINNHILTITDKVNATPVDLTPYLNVFENTNHVTSNERGDYATDDFVFGSPQLNYTGHTEHANRFYFNKNKGAFRAGRTSMLADVPDYVGDGWNDQNVGNYSMSFGYNTMARGTGSSSVGISSMSVGEASFSAGYESVALGNRSVALGYGAFAEGETTVALGTLAQAFGIHSTAIGNSVLSFGERSMAFGITNRANSYGETFIGINGRQANALSSTSFNSADRLFSIGNGVDAHNASNALVMLKNGNTRLHGLFTIDADNVIGAGEEYTLPGQDGAANQVMTTDGNGNVSWTTPISLSETDVDNFVSNNGYLTAEVDGSVANEIQDLSINNHVLALTNDPTPTNIDLTPYLNVFETTNNITSNENGDYATDDFVFGSPQLGNDGDASHNGRMFFDKSKGAFRVGAAFMNEWEEANMGDYSIGLGSGIRASGNYSVAFGSSAIASGHFSTAFGRDTQAAATYSSAFGDNSVATGRTSVAFGSNITTYSFAETAFGSSNTGYIPISANSWSSQDRLFVVGNGSNSLNPSDALVMLKNGNTRLNGQLTIDADNVSGAGGSYTFPGQRGTNGQVMVTNGSGVLSWSTLPIPTITTTANVTSNANGNYATDDFVFGSPQLADDGNATHDSRMFFDKSKAAFRAGYVSNSDWDDANIGSGSVAFSSGRATGSESFATGSSLASGQQAVAVGNNNTASGAQSVALGISSSATAPQSFASGMLNNASNNFAIAMGYGNSASGHASTSIGYQNTSSGSYSVSMGQGNSAGGGFALSVGRSNAASANGSTATGDDTNAIAFAAFSSGSSTTASGLYSFAGGQNSIASNAASVAFGQSTIASGQQSFAMGLSSQAIGNNSFASGAGNYARSFAETSIGLFSTNYGASSTINFIGTDRLFVIGNGTTDLNRSNAFVILKNGNTRLHGLFTIDADNVTGVGEPYTLPGQDGAANQVMTTDGNGNVSWTTPAVLVEVDGSITNEIQDLVITNDVLTITNNTAPTEINLAPYRNVFETTSNVTSNENGDYANDSFIFGSAQLDDDNGTTDDNTRMLFEKSTGAFRVGTVTDTRWDAAERGTNSVAMGLGNIARGNSSLSLGQNNLAHSESSVAIGTNNQAEGYNSIALGRNVATTGVHAMALSLYSASRSYGETTMGIYAADYVPNSTTNFDASDRLFTIGNGLDDANRSNALVIFKNGDATLLGTLTDASDMRLKRNIKPLQNSLISLYNLQGVHYQWNGRKPQDTVALQTGLIAQEVEKIFPELVKTDEEGFKSVNYIGLVPHLIEAIKELKAENEKLKSDTEKIKASTEERIAAMEARLMKIEALAEKVNR